MLLTVTPLENPGPPSPVPPPTAPKPGKDNARLQRLMRKAAKRSGAQPLPTQSPKTFRQTLSPVTEGDMENLEPGAARKNLLSPINLPPRFQFRGVVHRVPSPYPKQRSFTFTVPEQHSLNQYLSPSPVPDTPSPRPSSTHDNSFLFPSGGSTSDHTSLRVNGNASPRPCTPRHVTFNPTPTTQPVVPLIQVSDLPVIIMTETEPALELTNTDENQTEIQSNPIVQNTESGHSTLKSPPPNQQRPINMSVSSITVHLENSSATQQSTAITSITTNTSEIVECSRVAEISLNTSTLPSSPTDGNQKMTPVHTTDGGLPKIKTTSPPPEVKSIPKPAEPKPAISNTNVSTSAKNSEELNLLKSPERPKPPRKKPGGGWARLMKHLVVEPEEPAFPEPQKTEDKNGTKEETKVADTEPKQQSKGLRANKMWDALLYHMATSTKAPEKPASVEETTSNAPSASSAPAPPQFPFLRFRLPLLLHRPRFDARKLREAAARPLRRVTAFFHRRITDKSSSTFNRTASGWSMKEEDAEQENKEGDDAMEVKNE